MDPEIPVDVWNLGLIYSIGINKGAGAKSQVTISMSLTTPGCSMAKHIANDIKTRLENLADVAQVDVDIVWDPKWNTGMMTPEAREKLGLAEPDIFCHQGKS